MKKQSAPKTTRVQEREILMSKILETAREYLGTEGAAGISLRAIARDLGMVSSGIYRYIPTRDALLTLLITDAYNSLGSSVEKSVRGVPREDLEGRFLTIAHATRVWALSHSHEYSLIFGTPVPGYEAPKDTVAPASIIPMLLTEILRDVKVSHKFKTIVPISDLVASSVVPLQKTMAKDLPADLVLRGLSAWSSMFGAISFELFGHTHNVVSSDSKKRKAYFDHQMRMLIRSLNIV